MAENSNGPDQPPIKLFISYCWKHRKEAVRQLADFLSNNFNFKVWIDTNNMAGSTYEAMAQGIDDADVVIICFGEDYKQSENCKKEAEYASMQQKLILPVRIQREAKLTGWLGMVIGQRLWIDYSIDDAQQMETATTNIVKQIHILLKSSSNKEEPTSSQSRFRPPSKLANRFKTVDVPFFSKYLERNTEEENLLQEIKKICQKPKEGILVIMGGGGVGKTSLVARLFTEDRYTDALQREGKVDIAIWLNCFQWREADLFDDEAEAAFSGKLLQLVQRAVGSDSPTTKFFSLESAVDYFEDNLRRPVFIFDDVFNVKLLESFFRTCPNAACCVVTRDLPTKHQIRFVKKVHQIDELTDETVVDMLATSYELGDKLSREQIEVLASRCCRLPLIVSLLAARFEDTFDYDAEYQLLLSEKISDLGVDGPHETVLQLFEYSVARMEAKMRRSYQAYLFFDPAESVNVEDLAILWGFSGNDAKIKAMALCGMLEKKSLIRRVTKLSESDKDSNGDRTLFLVHQLLYEAALENARKEFRLDGDNVLEAIRLKIVTGEMFVATAKTAGSPVTTLVVLCEAIKRQRRNLLDRVISNINATDLAKLLASSSASLTGDLTFLHHLYRSHWNDNITSNDVKRMFGGVNHSYRLVAKILAKLHRFNVDYVQIFKQLATPNGDSLLFEVYNGGAAYFDERKPIKLYLAKWRHEYEEECWLKKEVANGNSALLQVLKWHKSDQLLVNQRQEGKDSTLIIAARLGKVELVKLLCSDKNNKDAILEEGEEGRTAMIYAAKNGHFKIVQFLYELCPDCITSLDFVRRSALTYAAETGNADVVKFLAAKTSRDHGGLQDYDGRTALMYAAENGHCEVVQFLYNVNSDVRDFQDSDGSTAIILAASNGHLDIVDFLYRRSPNSAKILDKKERSAAMHAAKNGHFNVVAFFAKIETPLLLSMDANKQTAFYLAAEGGYMDVVRYLFEQTPDAVYLKDTNGLTAAMAAAKSGRVEVVAFLANKVPEVFQMLDERGETTLIHAVESGLLSLVSLVYERYPEAVRIQSKTGLSALMAAAGNGDAEIVHFLVQKFPDSIVVQNNNKWTALFYACRNGSIDIARFLYEKYPEATRLEDINGFTPLTIASRNKHSAIVTFLANK